MLAWTNTAPKSTRSACDTTMMLSSYLLLYALIELFHIHVYKDACYRREREARSLCAVCNFRVYRRAKMYNSTLKAMWQVADRVLVSISGHTHIICFKSVAVALHSIACQHWQTTRLSTAIREK